MQKVINKSAAIRSIFTIICTCLIISIFPLNLWTQSAALVIPRMTNDVMGAVTAESIIKQEFIAEYDYLSSIDILLSGGSRGNSFTFCMFDPDGYKMFEDEIIFDSANLPGYYNILVDMSFEPDELYYYTIQSATEDTSLFLGVEWVKREDFPYIGRLYFEGYPMSGQNLVANYNYTVPLQISRALIITALSLLSLLFSALLVSTYYRRYPDRDTLLNVEQVVKRALNPLVIILMIAGLTAVCLQAFGPYLMDNIFFAVAVLLAGGICLYGINHNRDGQAAIINKTIFRENWLDYLQSFFFACAIYACCEYMNAGFMTYQRIAQNKQIIYLCLAMLTMLNLKQIFSYVNLLYLTVAGGFGFYYYTEQIRAGMDELKDYHIADIQTTSILYVIGGLVILNVIINVIKRLIKKEMRPVSVVFGILVLLLISLMIVFRNTREWPIILAICFVTFYLMYGSSRKSDIVLNICRGLILCFIYMLAYSLLYCPFATFKTARFGMMFKTSSVVAMYYAPVITAGLIILLKKMRESRHLKDLWKECVLVGVLLSYQLLSISTTGTIACIVVTVFLLIMMSCGKGRIKIKNMLRASGFIIMSFIICFPVVFFMQRNIPAFVGRPNTNYFQPFHQDIIRGRNPASYEHMRLGRFIEVYAEEFLGIPSNYFDFYDHIRNYEEQHVLGKSNRVLTIEKAEERGMDLDEFRTVAQVREEIMSGTGDYEEEEIEYLRNRLNIGSTEETDITNGRMDIYEAYINELNAFGHDIMGVTLPDGTIAYHAHSSYLQFAHDHGIYMGILYVIVGGFAIIKGIIYYSKNKDNEKYAALPVAVIIAAAVFGISEWVYLMSNPSGFLMMLMIAPLIFGHRGTEAVNQCHLDKPLCHSEQSEESRFL